MAALEEENGLADLPLAEFAKRVAWYYCEINMLHPFREGNGRAQRIFFEQLALHAGYLLEWEKLNPGRVGQRQSGRCGRGFTTAGRRLCQHRQRSASCLNPVPAREASASPCA